MDPRTQNIPYLSSLFPENPCLQPLPKMNFPSQSSILVPPSPHPTMFHHGNNSEHFQGHVINVANHNPAFVMRGHSSTPMYGVQTLSLGDKSTLGGGLVDNYDHNLLTSRSNNNLIDALNGYDYKGKLLYDFSQKSMIRPSEASPSHSLSPPLLLNKNELVMTQSQWNINQRMGNIRNDEIISIVEDEIIKGKWTPDEDRALVELVESYGLENWSDIAKLLYGRNGKQCRERWYNHIDPNINKDAWTIEEDKILIEAHYEMGKKWSEIAKRLSGRPENSIKNHWNSTKRRKNSKSQKNYENPNYEGSLLHAYIKRVTAVEQAAKMAKISAGKKNKKVHKGRSDDLAVLLGNDQHYLLDDVFNGSTSNYVPMQVNNGNANGGNTNYRLVTNGVMMNMAMNENAVNGAN